MTAPVVELTRGPMVENRYRGDVAVVDAAGRLLFRVGDAFRRSFWRSSAKPIQAMPLVLTGAAEAFGFSGRHLAIFAASHNGEPPHIEAVLDAMDRAGLSPDMLQCGSHAPFDQESAGALAAAGRPPEDVHNNCSGKHTGMLAMAKHLGLPAETYMESAAELQRLILANVAEVTGVPAGEIALGIDGCGVPVFGLPVANMAYAYARLAGPDHMPAGKAEAGRRFRDAMMDFPYLVAGRKRICTDLMGLPGRRFVAKSGAEGVYCVGILPEAAAASPVLQAAGAEGGVGLAVKIEDGNNQVRHQVVVEALRQLGLLTEEDLLALRPYTDVTIKNHAGTLVGEAHTVFALEQG
ncbi:MAG TPA: asparaginase [Symbiobacteriaceae bacterium]|nr:asparaginase [Symbiobacteriaceae bacterium]